ncbi:MAG: NADH-quinone oxidoreductase subunit L [Alicyclobacillus sp.]|nr:NADH-quinone oxidoreductase subunit L [Alicyclobacillus sp.]
MVAYAWLVPLLPLAAYVFLLVLGRRAPEGVAAGVSVVCSLASFLVSAAVFRAAASQGPVGPYLFHWLTLGSASISFGFEVTRLNALMILVVSLVSTLVLLYSAGYMHGDERFPVFYQYLNLFVFSMLALVLSPNLLQLYIFWEMVGLCSYLLVGFWYFKPEAALAAKKSFIVTRIGDTGLLIGIVLLYWASGSFDYSTVFAAAGAGQWSLGWVSGQELTTLCALLVFLGAVGKSAQFPLHVWLPDAMEGPTPVSALIHAATMVAAGVYLVARCYPLFQASPGALATVAWIGAITALLAALIALTQRDIKRVIAYSTVSQLGYMMLALGVGAYAYGVFHLMTHAFFKALLFLAAGSVIHAVDTQDLFEMGGLYRKLPLTAWTFLAGALALAGVVPFAGFWSKDDILAAALNTGHPVLWGMLLLAAFCTAFYIFRVYFLVFTGAPRQPERWQHAHEGSWVMTLPLLVLAAMATIAGFFNSPLNGDGLEHFLFADSPQHQIGYTAPENVPLMLLSLLVALLGIGLAAAVYWRPRQSQRPERWARAWGPFYTLSYRKFYLDEVYYAALVYTGKGIAAVVDWIDRYVIDALVRVVGRLVYSVSVLLKFSQTGQVQAYSTVAALGVLVLVAWAMLRAGGVH